MKRTLMALAFTAIAVGAQAQFTQNFDNVGGATTNGQLGGGALEGSGWFFKNNSAPRGLTDWFQGNTSVFTAHGGTGGYIGANFNNGAGLATISNWMLTPTSTLQNGAQLTFWTRTIDAPAFPDRLEVRMSTAGSSTNVGTSATDVGDFTTLLLTINNSLTVAGYPTSWTQFTVNVSGLGGPTTGRFAFRYNVPNAGPSGANSDYIGIDTVAYAVPEPGTMIALGLGVAALARRRRKA